MAGNHDYKLYDTLRVAAQRNGIAMLADEAAFIAAGFDTICIAGVYNSFRTTASNKALVEALPVNLFTLMLAHSPDFAQDSSVGCDLVLSGHTHGGQVTFFGLYTPVKNTKYGTRFLRGRNFTDNGVTVITTNGEGTSRRKVRFLVPSEIVVVTLRRR